MRQLTLLLLAAFLFTSCDNLKTKKSSSSEDDTEETTTKKKKKKALDEEDETSDEEPTKKKKKSSSSDDELTDEEDGNDETTSEYAQGWTKAQQKKFVNQCAETASKQVGQERAEEYCTCMMKKIEKRYPNADDINQMTETEINKLAKTCAQ